MSRSKKSRRFQYTNQHAAIQSRPNENALIGGETFTSGREDSLDAYIATDSHNSTMFEVSLGGARVTFTGRQARTLQRLLNKHYSSCATPTIPGTEF